MSVLDPYLVNTNQDVHLRDARHAHQLFTEYGHAFSPKNPFLYHVVFVPHPAIGSAATSNTVKFQKEIGVLAKSLDLPSFRATIENKQQYNRKKNAQTRIDYQDITVKFHDDNTGATRSMLEEYYKWYYVDGSYNSANGANNAASGAFDPRDKYAEYVPRYGLNVKKSSIGKEVPFFSEIRIYQLALQRWFSYVLVNPLLVQWQHGELSYGDGAGMVENTISVAYESVLYDQGSLEEGGEPVNFTHEETRYDNVPSPISYNDPSIGEAYKLTPKLLDSNSNIPSVLASASNSASNVPSSVNFNNQTQPGVLEQIVVPTSTGTTTTTGLTSAQNNPNIQGVISQLKSDPSATQSFVARAINSNNVANVTYDDWLGFSPQEQSAFVNTLADQAEGGNAKLAAFAQDAVDTSSGIFGDDPGGA
jgi:hypothetical protein